MIERAFVAAGLDWRYLTLEVGPDDLAAGVAGMHAMGFRGGNFTIPHKVAVIEHLDGLSEAAELMGAVNCIHRVDGKFHGENTDGKGFVQSLRDVTDPTDKRVVILGAGGAARAIAVELGLSGVAEITIVNRTAERGQELVDLLGKRVKVTSKFVKWDGDYGVEEDVDILINATSIGLYPDIDARLALNLDSLSADMVVADVIPNPPRTNFVKDAEARGCKVLDGLGMLVNQGITGIEYWTGVTVDGIVMRTRLEELFGA